MSSPAQPLQNIAPSVKLGKGVRIFDFTNLYGCEIGDDVKIGTFVEIQKGVKIGKGCKISSHTFICEGVTLEDGVFIGHNVTFINDRFPRATNRGRQAANRGRLDLHSHAREARRFHRFRGDVALRHHGRRERDRRRGQRGDQRRSAGHHCGGQSRAGEKIPSGLSLR